MVDTRRFSYQVIKSSDKREFERMVGNMLEAGFELVGGVSCDESYYMQSVVYRGECETHNKQRKT